MRSREAREDLNRLRDDQNVSQRCSGARILSSEQLLLNYSQESLGVRTMKRIAAICLLLTGCAGPSQEVIIATNDAQLTIQCWKTSDAGLKFKFKRNTRRSFAVFFKEKPNNSESYSEKYGLTDLGADPGSFKDKNPESARSLNITTLAKENKDIRIFDGLAHFFHVPSTEKSYITLKSKRAEDTEYRLEPFDCEY